MSNVQLREIKILKEVTFRNITFLIKGVIKIEN